ncbi:alanine racemase [Desulfotalea psychrophila]|uniref:Alanine racemase n=1 Tax=Desulfotalea psychrophila (strain LSv54 / DSM 12343) TaxID=177439 RepID=Q6AJJ8_DESPS|nr:alanine racemase [Desulfotalea psychrophila]CAG37482.1 related to alanine racemase [Desulfotalea psychrophila LSv54]
MKRNSFNNVTVCRSALRKNFKTMQDKMGQGGKLMAMVKADAYGHGAVEVAKALQDVACSSFGVAEIREAVLLRDAGITGDIFVMLGFDLDAVGLMFDYRLTPVVHCYEDIVALSVEGVKRGYEIGCHIKVDTGMRRLGFEPEQVLGVAHNISRLSGVFVAGMLSHFPEADVVNSPSSRDGIRRFASLDVVLKSEFSTVCHLANSGGVLNFPESLFDMGRSGISIYGYHPAGAIEGGGTSPFIPAMSFRSRILQVKKVAAGTGVSYGHSYITKRPTLLAVLPTGYEDGYRRSLSNKAEVLIRGQRAPVRGQICMNACVVDVTDIENVTAGDEVVLLGEQGNERITADDIAEWADTISYEILCMLGHTNNRLYVD